MKATETYEITWLIRRLFRAMASRSNESLSAQNINAADRAVLEFLYAEDALSVPEIASRYEVSRQHVQVTVNRLLEAGLVASTPNPRHRRSPLIRLTAAGKRLFEKILRNDKDIVEALFADISDTQVTTTRKTLQKLYAALSAGDDK